jgi:hypothetical protein
MNTTSDALKGMDVESRWFDPLPLSIGISFILLSITNRANTTFSYDIALNTCIPKN